ncbi:Putative deoxyribonuclease RhsC [Halomicronema hongdechloris C2206]|uniref:Deoxyribonuclease RhsC n=1 Tax=Halomicronema hongdechloris C2206 TaxID=1641165 RepID=A0A1Z3HQ89_9CYAN|nr:RHS repeat protein [Halomicronema hongdechloris]ASC72317.1 Putative deoxyribonuclease RhsC [Halomicronema hongdechloris C2206]
MEKVISVLGMNLSPVTPSGQTQPTRAQSHQLTPDQSSTATSQKGLNDRADSPTYRYDDRGRLIAVDYPNGTHQTFAYDARDNLIRRQTAAGRVLHYSYDAQNRLRCLSDRRGHTTITDFGLGWVCFATPTCVTVVQFDPQQRVSTIQQTIDGVTFQSDYRYDDAGRCIGLRPAGSDQWLHYRYEVNPDSPTQTLHVQTEHGTPYATLSGQTWRFANGIVRQRLLDDQGKPARIVIQTSEGTLLVDWPYIYRDLQIEQIGPQRFGYDGEGRLTTWQDSLGQVTRYTYDAHGNRRTVADHTGVTRYCYDVGTGGGDRLLQVTSPEGNRVDFDYDLDGNCIARRQGNQLSRYTYDVEGQLTTVQLPDGRVIHYTYDGLGRRVKRQMGDQITLFHYDCNDQLLAETDAQGRVTATYLWVGVQCLGCIRGPVGETAVDFYGTDHLGSVWLVTNETRQVTWQGNPSPFGTTGSPLFARKPLDVVTGFYDFGSRDYDPATGRFLTPDSYTFGADDWRLLFQPERDFWGDRKPRSTALQDWLQQTDSQNRYVFCLNDPINNLDLDGHSAWWFFLTIPSSLTWALPNTTIGLILVIGNLLMEIIGWIPWFFESLFRLDFDRKWYPWGRLNPANPFDADERAHFWINFTASARQGVPWTMLNGSFFVWRAYTMGNIVYIESSEDSGNEADTDSRYIVPKAPDVQLNRPEALYSHEMQHVFQYALLGPLFHALPVPLIVRLIQEEDLSEGDKWWEKISIGGLTWLIGGLLWAVSGGNVDPDDVQNWVNPSTWWSSVLPYKWVAIISNAWDLNNWVPGVGVYEWDMVINGGQTNSALERNAGAQSGNVYKTVVEAEKTEIYVGEFTRVTGADVVFAPNPATGGPPFTPITVDFSITPAVNNVPTGAGMVPGTLAPNQLPHSINLDRNNTPPVQVINGSAFYFHSLTPGTFTVKGEGSFSTPPTSETVDITVKAIEVDAETAVFVCQRQTIKLKGDEKASYHLQAKGGVLASGGSVNGLTYTAGDTAGTDTLELIARYDASLAVFSTYGDNGLTTSGPNPRDYLVKEIQITVDEPTITPDTQEIFVGGVVTFTIDHLPDSATVSVGTGSPLVTKIPGSQFNRSELQFIAGKGPIAADEIETITFDYGCKDYPFDIKVKPITAVINPATVNGGGTAQITVTGGVPPYRYVVSVPNSSGPEVDETGRYTAGSENAQVADTITITDRDGDGGRARVQVMVRPMTAAINPVQVAAGATANVTVQSGVSPFDFSIVNRESEGSSIDSSGRYTAGTTPGVDTIQVTDDNGTQVTVTIRVMG